MLKGFKVIKLEEDGVMCDSCGKDFTGSNESGGFLFMSNAICPDCQEWYLKNIKKYKEEKYIKGYCPENMSFYDWVLSIR